MRLSTLIPLVKLFVIDSFTLLPLRYHLFDASCYTIDDTI